MIRELPALDPVAPATDGPGPDHPMRKVTRQVAFEPGGWTAERSGKVQALFDRLSEEWASRHSEARLLPLRDALDRGGVSASSCVDLGAGTGPGAEYLRTRFERVYAIDLSHEMLRRLDPAWGHRVQADGSQLPLRDASADVLVLMNMLLFPAEVDRVLAPGGRLVWVNSRGERTPIHLSPDDVATALPGTWRGTSARAGQGLWCVLERAGA